MIRTLLWVWALWVVVALYVGEAAMGLILEKSIALSPVPPHSTQRHTTSDYAVSYHYNNIGLRGPDFDPDVTYDALLIGDSFLFGTGVEENQTITGLLTAGGLRVFVAAEPATNPPQYLQKSKMLAAWGLRSRALVIGLFVGNDFQGLARQEHFRAVVGVVRRCCRALHLAVVPGAAARVLYRRQRTREIVQERTVPA